MFSGDKDIFPAPRGGASLRADCLAQSLLGGTPSPPGYLQSSSYIVFRLQNLGRKGLIWKIFHDKDLARCPGARQEIQARRRVHLSGRARLLAAPSWEDCCTARDFCL